MWTLWLRTNNWALGSALWKVNLLRIRVKFILEITFSIGCINISRRISRRFTHSIQRRVDYSEREEEKVKSIKCPTKNLYIDIWRCPQFIDNDDTSLPLIFNCFLQLDLHFGWHTHFGSQLLASPSVVTKPQTFHRLLFKFDDFQFCSTAHLTPWPSSFVDKEKKTYTTISLILASFSDCDPCVHRLMNNWKATSLCPNTHRIPLQVITTYTFFLLDDV